MKNKLIIVGWTGDKRAYLNLEKDEAVRRYLAHFPYYSLSELRRDPEAVREIEFDTEFCVYDAWATDK